MREEPENYLLLECSDRAMLDRLERAISLVSDRIKKSQIPKDSGEDLIETLMEFQEDMRSRPNGEIMIELTVINIMRKLGV